MARPITEIEVGRRFGRLKFVEDLGKDYSGRRIAKFSCDCGNEKTIRVHSVFCGQVISCGCLRGKSHAVTEEEKQRMRELSRSMSPYAIARQLNRDRTTVVDVLNPNANRKKDPKEGFFDVDAFFRSDFILQA